MKKLTILCTLLTGSLIYASPVLSPSLPAVHPDGLFFYDRCNWWDLRAGFRGDYVFNRPLKNQTNQPVSSHLYANEGVLTLNIFDRIEVYSFVGGATQGTESTIGSVDEITQYESQTIWGVGIRGILYKSRCFGCLGTTFFGVDANYESMKDANPTTTLQNGSPIANSVTSHFREWQVSLQLGQKIKFLTPYIAIKGSSAINILSTNVELRSQQHFGYAVGVSLADAGRMSITAEARFVDEKAATIDAEFRF